MAKAEDVKEILDTRREFTMETPTEVNHYFIANPTGEDIRKADWQYSKIYNQAIVDGFLTQAQMVEVLKEKKIISDDYTERLERVRTSLAAELFKLENLVDEASEEQKESIALEVASLRDELFQINQTVNGPMGNTCENLAEDARTEFLTSRIIQTKDGTKSWEEFQDYREEENTALCIKSRFEVMLWMQGLGSDFLENTPEQKMLREIAQSRLERAIAASQEMVDKKEAKVKKPRTRKNKTKKVEAKEAAPEEVKTEEVKTEEAVSAPSPVEEISLDAVIDEQPKAKRGRPKGAGGRKPAKKKQPVKKDE